MTDCRRPRARRRLVLPLLLLAGAPLAASTPTVWEHPSHSVPLPGGSFPAERMEPRSEGVAIGESGALTLSVPLREVFPGGAKVAPPPILWTSALDQGGNLYVGVGNTGEVLRIDRKGATVSTFDTNELAVRALASSVSGDLYVGTFPAGGVYRVKGSSGKAEPWFDPEDRYIWAMAIDKADDLYVATGERGIIYEVTGKSQGRVVFDSDEAHIMALALDHGGRLLAGTAPSGILYRVGGDGRAETLLDSGLDEITSIAVTPDGVIYAASIGEELPTTPRKPGEKNDLMIEVTPAPDGSTLEEETEQPRKIIIDLAELLAARAAGAGGEGTASRLYRIDPGRAPVVIWKSDVERVFSLAWTGERGLIFGTGGAAGGGGRIYRLEPDGSATVIDQVRESQVTSLLASPDGKLYACTSNPGRVYLIDNGSIPSGSYLSAVYDAGRRASWGTIGWDADVPAGTRIEITTRSGNRPTPDGSWSSWSPPYSSEKGSNVASPPARFVQWKAELSRLKTEATPLLRRVHVSLLPENRPPVLRGLRVLDPGTGIARGAAAPDRTPADKGGTPADRPPLDKALTDKAPTDKVDPPKESRWVFWSAADPDDDQLAYRILLRRAGENSFHEIAAPAAPPPWALNDANLPEGDYLLEVAVDDSRTNGAQRALSATEISDPFVVDHTPPRLELKPMAPAAGRLVAEVTATDAVGTIARAEAIVGDDTGASWSLPCRDGICDTAVEVIPIDVPDPGPGRKVTVRVYDAAGNMASVEIPGGSRKGEGP